MITITNEKVAGFEPRWASFRGFSLLFDNPGQGLAPLGVGGLAKIDCRADAEPALRLYKAFARSLEDSPDLKALDDMGRDVLVNTYLFCPLPPASYHVTVWDGGNDSNVNDMNPDSREEFRDFLGGLPGSLRRGRAFTRMAAESALAATTDRTINFKFDRLTKWGDRVLVARLEPADSGSRDVFEGIAEKRKALSAEFREAFGIGAGEKYNPHVSLGYFANRELAELSTCRLGEWTGSVRACAGDLVIGFSSISLYGFTDMATFFKPRERGAASAARRPRGGSGGARARRA